MIRTLIERFRQGHRTMAYPKGPAPAMPDRFQGRPLIDGARCTAGCTSCVQACPSDAVSISPQPRIDLGRCTFCGECAAACEPKAVLFSRDHRMAVRRREDLIVAASEPQPLAPLDGILRRMLGRALKLRQVSAGGCNACEADTNVLGTVGWDLGRFGIQFVASPRHADGVLVTGPVPRNMRLGLQKTWDAVPEPKIAIAVGACAIGGGPFVGSPEIDGRGAAGVIPIDLYVPGCPPHPLTILDGLLRLLGRIS